jgi:hypothetical protein
VIPADPTPILDRLQITGELWAETIRHFGRWFRRAFTLALQCQHPINHADGHAALSFGFVYVEH